jgi:phage-related protein
MPGAQQNEEFPILKEVEFLGSSREDLKDFPEDPQREAGFQLDRVQRNLALKTPNG